MAMSGAGQQRLTPDLCRLHGETREDGRGAMSDAYSSRCSWCSTARWSRRCGQPVLMPPLSGLIVMAVITILMLSRASSLLGRCCAVRVVLSGCWCSVGAGLGALGRVWPLQLLSPVPCCAGPIRVWRGPGPIPDPGAPALRRVLRSASTSNNTSTDADQCREIVRPASPPKPKCCSWKTFPRPSLVRLRGVSAVSVGPLPTRDWSRAEQRLVASRTYRASCPATTGQWPHSRRVRARLR